MVFVSESKKFGFLNDQIFVLMSILPIVVEFYMAVVTI